MASVFALVLLAGCMQKGTRVDENWTVAEAKDSTQEIERRIARAVPDQYIVSTEQLDKGSFLSCGDGGHQWSGFQLMKIIGDPEPEALLQPVRAEFEADSTLRTMTRQDEVDAILEVMSDDGALWITRYRRARGELVTHSFSGCFRLPDDIWPGSPY